MPEDPITPEGEKPTLTPDQFKAETERARKEAATYREKLRAAEAALAERDGKDAVDKEEAARKAGDLERHLADLKKEREADVESSKKRERALHKRLVDEALRARLTDAIDADVARMIDRKGIEVDADTLEISGLDEAVAAFRESKSVFFKPASDPSPPGTGLGRGPVSTSAALAKANEFDSGKSIKDQLAAFR